jgi:hypothetical protein
MNTLSSPQWMTPVVLALCLAACTPPPPLAIDPIQVNAKDPSQRIPGRYVAFVNSAPSSISGNFHGCPFYTTPAALIAVYGPALQAALINNFEQVDFPSTPLSPAQIAASGYRAGFVFTVMQSHNAPPRPGIIPQLVYAGSMVLLDAAGSHPAVPVSGSAPLGAAVQANCGDVQQIIAQATRGALTDLIQQDLNAARNAIRPPPRPGVARPAF